MLLAAGVVGTVAMIMRKLKLPDNRIKILIQGLVKARRFKNARNKLAYRYVLTPAGMSEKVAVTRRCTERMSRRVAQLSVIPAALSFARRN